MFDFGAVRPRRPAEVIPMRRGDHGKLQIEGQEKAVSHRVSENLRTMVTSDAMRRAPTILYQDDHGVYRVGMKMDAEAAMTHLRMAGVSRASLDELRKVGAHSFLIGFENARKRVPNPLMALDHVLFGSLCGAVFGVAVLLTAILGARLPFGIWGWMMLAMAWGAVVVVVMEMGRRADRKMLFLAEDKTE